MSRSLCEKNPRKQETLAAAKWGHVFPKRPWNLVGIYDQQLQETINFWWPLTYKTWILETRWVQMHVIPPDFQKIILPVMIKLNDSSRGIFQSYTPQKNINMSCINKFQPDMVVWKPKLSHRAPRSISNCRQGFVDGDVFLRILGFNVTTVTELLFQEKGAE